MGFKEDKLLYQQRRNAIRSMRSAGISDELIAVNLNIKLEELNNYNDKWSIKYYDKKIVEMYLAGKSGQEIADEIGYSVGNVCLHLRTNHSDIYKGQAEDIPKPVREMMVKWAKEGKSLKDICELTNYPKYRVYPVVIDYVRKHPPGWRVDLTREEKDEIKDLFINQGLSISQIAKRMKRYYSCIQRFLQREGLYKTGDSKLKKSKNSQTKQTQQQVGETKL